MPNATELRELDDDELEMRLAEYRREVLNLRFQLATGQLDNVARIGVVRRDIARVLTILRDREIALIEGRPAGPVAAPARPERPRPARRPADEEAPAEDDDEVTEAELDYEDDVEEAVAEAMAADDTEGDTEGADTEGDADDAGEGADDQEDE